MNDLAVIEQQSRALSVAEVRTHVNLIQQVMQSVMKPKVHYDTIPGTDKPSLLKPGAEVLMSTFRISVKPEIEDLSTSDEIRYRVHCIGTHQTSGIVMGTGIGECSSNEEKYKWRRAVCEEEFDETPPDRRRVKYARGRDRTHYTIQQIRTEPADVANTILKMAKKRGLVDFTLTALSASDIFAQDVEDLPEELRETVEAPVKREVKQPTAKSSRKQDAGMETADPDKKVNEGQQKVILSTLDKNGVSAQALCEQFKVDSVANLPFKEVNNVLKWIAENKVESD